MGSPAEQRGPNQRDRERFSNRRAALAAAARISTARETPTTILSVADQFFEWLEQDGAS